MELAEKCSKSPSRCFFKGNKKNTKLFLRGAVNYKWILPFCRDLQPKPLRKTMDDLLKWFLGKTDGKDDV
jgi:hypothetical protein